MSTAQEPTGRFIASTSGGSPATGNFTLRMPLVAQRVYTRPESARGAARRTTPAPRRPPQVRHRLRPGGGALADAAPGRFRGGLGAVPGRFWGGFGAAPGRFRGGLGAVPGGPVPRPPLPFRSTTRAPRRIARPRRGTDTAAAAAILGRRTGRSATQPARSRE
ncbi:hypothetical protein TNCT1_30480 [Streptomyces sp. 1-11]|nr:hypothetical protein TNCT1_30480 [Streptomyces sp. 1-11]